MSVIQQTQEQRISELEQRVKYLEGALTDLHGWQPLTKAANFFKCSPDELRRQIRLCKSGKNRRFGLKRNVHWRQMGSRYQVNIVEWKKLYG